MFKLYQRYISREVLLSILLVLFAFLTIFTFFDFIEELRRVGRGTYKIYHAIFFELLSIPGLCYELMPIAVLIGTLYALSNLARHSEITVLRASGLATKKLLFLLFSLATFLAIITFIFGEIFVPFCEQKAQELKNNALNQMIAQAGFSSGLWVKDNKSFINVKRALPNARLENIRIYQFDENNYLLFVKEAKEAEFISNGEWILYNAVTTEIKNNERARVFKEEKNIWQTVLTPQLLEALSVSPEKMSMNNLLNYKKHLSDNAQQTERYEIALWKKFIYPLSALVMVALALPFAYSHNRVAGVSLKLFVGVMLGVIFHALNGLFSNLGMINSWPPFASAAAPSFLFLMLAVFMLYWVEKR